MTNHLFRPFRPFGAFLLALPWLLPLGACASRDCETLRLCDEPNGASEKQSDGGSDSGRDNDKTSTNDGSAGESSKEKEESAKGSVAGGTPFPFGSGGTTAATGGAPGASGGALGATGGAPAATGGARPTATGGTVGEQVECAGASFDPVKGFYDNGTFCGHGFTYTFADGGTVVPDQSFEAVASGLCIDGAVPASDNNEGTYPGIALGVNLRQDPQGNEDVYVAAGSGVTITYATGGGSNFRASFITADGDEYCAHLSGTGSDSLSWGDFSIFCFSGTGASLKAGTELKQFSLEIQADATDQAISQACLKGLDQN